MSRPTVTRAIDHLWDTLEAQGFCNLGAQSATAPWAREVADDVQALLDTRPSRRTVEAVDALVWTLGRVLHARVNGAEWRPAPPALVSDPGA